MAIVIVNRFNKRPFLIPYYKNINTKEAAQLYIYYSQNWLVRYDLYGQPYRYTKGIVVFSICISNTPKFKIR